jgi:hypothetical protein
MPHTSYGLSATAVAADIIGTARVLETSAAILMEILLRRGDSVVVSASQGRSYDSPTHGGASTITY